MPSLPSDHRSLAQLNLSGNLLCGITFTYGKGTYTAEGINAIADALRVNGALTSLDLRWNKLGAEGGTAIAEALKVNGALTSLNLDGFVLPIKQLKGTERVDKLDLSGKYEKLGAASAIVIAKCIEVNGALTSLNLACCGIGNEGAKAIADALRVNGALTSLNLNRNRVGAEGAAAIGEALKVNGALTSLDLSHNLRYNLGVKASLREIATRAFNEASVKRSTPLRLYLS